MADVERSRAARTAAERALVRVVHHYGARPEFVVLGGLVPELLCGASPWRHAGTTDIDVHVDLEVACGAVNAARLENALRNAEFEPDGERVWRWVADAAARTVVKFELLADIDTEPNEAVMRFDACEQLGAVNLRGTGFASRDVEARELTAKVGDDLLTIEVSVAGLAGFLLAKSAAARSRRKPKDCLEQAVSEEHEGVAGSQLRADLGERRRRLANRRSVPSGRPARPSRRLGAAADGGGRRVRGSCPHLLGVGRLRRPRCQARTVRVGAHRLNHR